MRLMSSSEAPLTDSQKTPAHRGHVVARVLASPGLVALVRMVDALEAVRNPSDPAFGERNLDVREFTEHWRPHEVGCCLNDVDRRQGHEDVNGSVGCCA